MSNRRKTRQALDKFDVGALPYDQREAILTEMSDPATAARLDRAIQPVMKMVVDDLSGKGYRARLTADGELSTNAPVIETMLAFGVPPEKAGIAAAEATLHGHLRWVTSWEEPNWDSPDFRAAMLAGLTNGEAADLLYTATEGRFRGWPDDPGWRDQPLEYGRDETPEGEIRFKIGSGLMLAMIDIDGEPAPPPVLRIRQQLFERYRGSSSTCSR